MTTVIFPHPEEPPSLPALRLEGSENKSPIANNPKPSTTGGQKDRTVVIAQPAKDSDKEAYRILSQDEWVQFCQGVGVFKDGEHATVIRPTSWYWPPKGFPDGLYQDILYEKTKFSYYFHILSTIRWTLMILQLALNATLTALGSLSSKDSVAITVIAGVNTLFSGILALMHNSGLPDRYRSDKNEFYKVEEYLKEIVDTRLVPENEKIEEVMASCYDKFRLAKQTVQDNIPASYITSNMTNARSGRVSQPPLASKA